MACGADVQLEAGNWSRIHNLILEQLAKAELNGREAKCLFFLLRMTYGKQQKEHEISLSLWADGTAIDKRHVKPVIDRLIERRIIVRIDGKVGRGNTAIYGFNKYFEQWDSEEKVPSTVPIEKVPETVPFIEDVFEEKVPSTVPEKVPSTVPIIERREVSSSAAANCEPPKAPRPSKSEFVSAYERVWGMMIPSPYIAEQIGDWETRITVDGWRYALQECADRKHIGNWSYLRQILNRIERDGYQPKTQILVPQTASVDFALEEVL